MAYGDRPSFKGWQKAALAIYTIAVLISAPVLFAFSIVSGCPAFAPVDCIPASQFTRFMFFPGALALELAGGFEPPRDCRRP